MPESVVLCLSGLDPSGAAGILRDVRTIERAGGAARAICTCLTAQTRIRCTAVTAVPPGTLREQLELLLSDETPSAIKVGLVPDAATWSVLLESLAEHGGIPLVVDPVRSPTAGGFEAGDDVRDVILQRVCRLGPILTPNAAELAWLGGHAGLLEQGARAVLVKGGHTAGDAEVCDVLHEAEATHRFRRPRHSDERRGTGCALSALLAQELALGLDLTTAARVAGHMLWRIWDDLDNATAAATS